jgi:hypothetical protein
VTVGGDLRKLVDCSGDVDLMTLALEGGSDAFGIRELRIGRCEQNDMSRRTLAHDAVEAARAGTEAQLVAAGRTRIRCVCDQQPAKDQQEFGSHARSPT